MAKAHGDKDTKVFPDEATDVGEKNGKSAKKEEKKLRSADPAATLKSLQDIIMDDDTDEATPEPVQDQIAELLEGLDAASASAVRVPLKEWTRSQRDRFQTRSTIANQGVAAAMARAGAIY